MLAVTLSSLVSATNGIGVAVSIALIAVLVYQEVVRAKGTSPTAELRRLNYAVVPLFVIFCSIITLRLAHMLQL